VDDAEDEWRVHAAFLKKRVLALEAELSEAQAERDEWKSMAMEAAELAERALEEGEPAMHFVDGEWRVEVKKP
jgi:hypothetical protein